MRSLRSLPRRLPQLARAPRRSLSTARLSDLELENARLREEIARLRQPTRPTGESTLFVGAKSSYTTSMDFWYPHVDTVPAAMPCFRIMDDLGRVVPGAEAHVPALSREHAIACMHTMLRVNEFDKIFLDAQRQGRISFYLTGRGEEGATVGSAAALQPDDWVLPQYRELGVF
jgi:2-oxoisovalerate dehydrogenase E1 component alpha subunit